MTTPEQAKGSDGKYITQVIGGDGLPVNLTGYANIALFLQYKNDITKLKKYDVASETLTVLDAEKGILEVTVHRADIDDLKTGDLYKIVKTYETDEDYADDTHKISTVKSKFITITEDSSRYD